MSQCSVCVVFVLMGLGAWRKPGQNLHACCLRCPCVCPHYLGLIFVLLGQSLRRSCLCRVLLLELVCLLSQKHLVVLAWRVVQGVFGGIVLVELLLRVLLGAFFVVLERVLLEGGGAGVGS